MLPTLSSLFQGPFAALHDRVLLTQQAQGEVVAARQLCSPDGLDQVLDRYAVSFMTSAYRRPDRRALMSQWSKCFLSQTVYVPVAANLLLDRQLPMTLDEVGVQLDEQGLVDRLVVPHEGQLVAAAQRDAEARLRPLMDDLLWPVIDAMAGHTGIAPKALWSNVGHYYEYLIGQLQGLSSYPEAVDEGERLMTLHCFADGRRNPLYQPIRYVEESGGDMQRLRRVCCVRYKLPGLDYCGNCPLPAACAMRRKTA